MREKEKYREMERGGAKAGFFSAGHTLAHTYVTKHM